MLSKADAHTGGSLRLVVTVPEVIGALEVVVPFPQLAKKATGAIIPSAIASAVLEGKRYKYRFITLPLGNVWVQTGNANP